MIGLVYRIIHTESDLCYIGSTTSELRFRWQGHRGAYKRWVDGKGSTISIFPHFKEHGIDKFRMLLIKEYEVEDRKHLFAYEQLWINKFRATAINKCDAIDIKPLTKKRGAKAMRKRREANKESVREYAKQYYLDNKAKFQAQSKERLKEKFNCGCGGIYSRSGKSNHYRGKKHIKWAAEQNQQIRYFFYRLICVLQL
jgi:hypothetical protein